MAKTQPAGLGGPSRKIKRFGFPKGVPVRNGTVKKDYGLLHAYFRASNLVKRQQTRKILAAKVWLGLSGANALRDEHGIVPRRVRRDIAKNLRKRSALAAKNGGAAKVSK
jgi:hypothetical protein